MSADDRARAPPTEYHIGTPLVDGGDAALQLRSHRGRDRLEITLCNLDQPESERIAPIAFSAREFEPIEQWQDRGLLRLDVVHVAAKGTKAIAHIDLIGAVVLGHADGGERLYAILASERKGRRIVHDAIAGADTSQRPAFAVADLHDPESLAAARMVGRRDGEPIAAVRVRGGFLFGSGSGGD